MKRLYQRSFSLWQALGVHVTPNHYYLPIPDTRTLDARLWERRSAMIGVNFEVSRFLQLLELFSRRYRAEYERFPREKTASPSEYYVRNRMFESVDGEILYCMIRHFKPRKVFEIGSGFSTMLSAQALLKNRSEDPSRTDELVAVDLHPSDALRKGFPGLSRMIAAPVQEVSLEEFEALGEDDILFIDSSHVLRIGNDVQMEYLEILPRLAKGVLVHVHDIFLPAEYPRDLVMKDRLFFTEQYVLQAFLTFNDRFESLWGSSAVHLQRPDALVAALPSYRPEDGWWPRSFWMRRVR